jgi:hypothetical protein
MTALTAEFRTSSLATVLANRLAEAALTVEAPLQMDASGNLKVSGTGDTTFAGMLTHLATIATAAADTSPAEVKPASVTCEYETVAASQTAQALGATGAAGDYISHILVVPATTSPGQVLLLDNATSITLFPGGASSVGSLIPFVVPLQMISVSGAWKITTGANVSVIAVGNFT